MNNPRAFIFALSFITLVAVGFLLMRSPYLQNQTFQFEQYVSNFLNQTPKVDKENKSLKVRKKDKNQRF